MKNIKNLNELNENKNLNISDVMFSFDVKDISYDDGLSEFMFEVAGKLGGGLPDQYFNHSELNELENIFRKIYDANTDLSNLLYKKN
jgi:hypothetical protein